MGLQLLGNTAMNCVDMDLTLPAAPSDDNKGHLEIASSTANGNRPEAAEEALLPPVLATIEQRNRNQQHQQHQLLSYYPVAAHERRSCQRQHLTRQHNYQKNRSRLSTSSPSSYRSVAAMVF
uniref:Uncharacterized protein n=1 Tax=Anopheles atroparvus TaxID=41427 RepID=A0A182JMQ9_ANOAO